MIDSKSHNFLIRILTAYYGVLEVIHLCVLAWAGLRLMRTGTIGFPAPPPPGGWTAQTLPFLVATGAVDAVNVVLALIYVYGYFRKMQWHPILGAITLTATAYSGLIFIYGTVATGAWSHHPAVYWGVVLAFVPVVGLMILHTVRLKFFAKDPTSRYT